MLLYTKKLRHHILHCCTLGLSSLTHRLNPHPYMPFKWLSALKNKKNKKSTFESHIEKMSDPKFQTTIQEGTSQLLSKNRRRV